MVKYLKNPNSVIKVDTELKTLIFYILEENISIIRKNDTEDIYNNITVDRYNQGKYVDATEEEFIAFKDLCLNKFN